MAEALWTSAEIAAAVRGKAVGGDFVASGVAIDSREVANGDLFVALTGQRDGHQFIEAALAAGAAGALTSKAAPGPAIRVNDTLAALADLGMAARDRAAVARRGAVTGSVGKTSVTQAVLAGLQRAGHGHGSVRSFNNHIGVPLTLSRMPRATRRAVFEMGMNHAGEIAPLSRMVRPHVAAVTNVEARSSRVSRPAAKRSSTPTTPGPANSQRRREQGAVRSARSAGRRAPTRAWSVSSRQPGAPRSKRASTASR
jgi:UDP-N-acetylmuramoyl-tripeptide--D-alanyl-D-alanine ligase